MKQTIITVFATFVILLITSGISHAKEPNKYEIYNVYKITGNIHLTNGTIVPFDDLWECGWYNHGNCLQTWGGFNDVPVNGVKTTFNAKHIDKIYFYNVRRIKHKGSWGSRGEDTFEKQMVFHTKNGKKISYTTQDSCYNRVGIITTNAVTLEMDKTTVDVDKIKFIEYLSVTPK